jgi:hypothetical protein
MLAMNAKPWDLLKKDNHIEDDFIINSRMSTCLDCDRYIHITSQCKECGCIMPLKTKLKNASCPLGKWDIVED